MDHPPRRRIAFAAVVVVIAVGVAVVGLAVGAGRALSRDEVVAPHGGGGGGRGRGARGRATVVVYDEGRPVAARRVVFHDARGAVTAVASTDGDGRASAEVAPSAIVTVAPGSSVHRLVSVLGVEPGDELVIGEDDDEGGPADVVCMAHVSLPRAPPGAARLVATLGVGFTETGDATAPLALPVLSRFLVDGRFRVYAEAQDASGRPIAYAHAWFSGCATAAGRGHVIVAQLPAWRARFRAFETTVTDVPEDVAALRLGLALLLVGGDRLERRRVDDAVRDRERPLAARWAVPEEVDAPALQRIEARRGDPLATVTRERSVLVETIPRSRDGRVVSLRERLLPRVSAAEVERTGDRTRPIARWRVDGDATFADTVLVRLSWPETAEHVWTIVAPPATTHARAPALPDELASARPSAAPIRVSVALVEASAYGGYADVRRKGLGPLGEDPRGEAFSLRYASCGEIDF